MDTRSLPRATVMLFLLAMFCAHVSFSAEANDTSAELTTGGLVFTKNADVDMLSEDLLLSTPEIRVNYRFLNRSSRDVTINVAFPLPDLKMDPDDDVTVIPVDDPINFLGFVTTVDGIPVHANVGQRAYVRGRDQTGVLAQFGLQLSPYRARDSLDKLSPSDKGRLMRLGLVNEDGVPLWTLKTTFYWQQRFPAGREMSIEHRYKPSVGSTVGVDSSSLIRVLQDPQTARYYRKYCIDSSFLSAVASTKTAYFSQQRIEYVLKTGSNWAGPIQRFRLVVDKGRLDNLVSFCGQSVKRIGPTQFEMIRSDFVPQDNLAILILQREAPPPGEVNGPADRNQSIPAPSAGSCDDLWYQRNSIFKGAGYCFKTPRAISVFGNTGCQYDDANEVPLSENQRQTLDEIKRATAANRCR
jgi:hypothetical protein